MADAYVIELTDTHLEWYIYGLQSFWNTSNYVKCGVATGYVSTDGQSSPPSGIIEEHNAPSSGTNNYTPQYTDAHGLVGGDTGNFQFYVYTPGSQMYYRVGAYRYEIPGGTVQLDTPSFDTSETQKTHNTISVEVYSVSDADRYYFEISTNSSFTNIIDTQNSTSRTAYFSGLSAGTTYYIRVKATATGYDDSEWRVAQATTTIAAGWNWQHSTLPGNDIALTRSEWLDFQDKINEIRNGRGYSSYTFTTSTTEIYGGKPIKASHFNEAINAINTMLSSLNDMDTVSAEDMITSAKMTEMKDKLNSCIV